jgi:hypothetical protein
MNNKKCRECYERHLPEECPQARIDELQAKLSLYTSWQPSDPGTKEAMEAIRELMAVISPGKWDWSRHNREDNKPPESIEDIVEILAQSARLGKGLELHGVIGKEGAEDIMVCYTGNGPHSAANARFLANAPEAIRWLLDFSRAAMVRLEEAEKDSVPRSRYNVACEQYTECEKERKRLFDRCRELERAL